MVKRRLVTEVNNMKRHWSQHGKILANSGIFPVRVPEVDALTEMQLNKLNSEQF
jgi:hypothetical protein